MIKLTINSIRNAIAIGINSKWSYTFNTLSVSINILNEATVLNITKRTRSSSNVFLIPKAKTFVELVHLFIELNESLFSAVTIALQSHSPRERSSIKQ